LVLDLIENTKSCPSTFDERQLFQGQNAQVIDMINFEVLALLLTKKHFNLKIGTQGGVQGAFPKCD
jgi:hypothetical protein